jgi:tetratricopeptide (TPR) repeat protein
MKKKLFTLLIVAMSFVIVHAAETYAGLEAGTKAYNLGDYERAIDEWRSCADNGLSDADLFYNLGNAYFRNGKLGFSIFYYKKALRLRANDEDILHNLKYAQAMTRDKVDEEEEENPILSALFRMHHAISLKAQLWIMLGIFWVIAFAAVAIMFSLREKLKNIFTGIIFALTIVLCVFGASAGYKIIVLETDITGVVTAADADVTSAPSDKAQTLNTLSEGTSFQVISTQGNYAEIKLGEKIKGFVRLSDVGIVE